MALSNKYVMQGYEDEDSDQNLDLQSCCIGQQGRYHLKVDFAQLCN